MFQLTKEHRSSLIVALGNCNEQIDSNKAIIEEHKRKNKNGEDKGFMDHMDIALFLETERKTLIEESLVNNEIDY